MGTAYVSVVRDGVDGAGVTLCRRDRPRELCDSAGNWFVSLTLGVVLVWLGIVVVAGVEIGVVIVLVGADSVGLGEAGRNLEIKFLK